MKKGTTTYSYDSMGNLLKVVLPDNRVITYKVDARGRRIAKYIDGVFIYGFVYGDQLNPIAKVDESGNIIEYYVYGLKSNIPEYVVKDNVKYKIISDHLGSPLEVRATTGGLPVLSCKYDSFGNIIEESGDFELPFRFAGGIWDEDTKLIRFGVRDYDPEVGRWTSVEPLGFAGSRNWYVYSTDDPVGKIDLDGRAYTCKRPLKGIGGIWGPFYHEYICTDSGVCSGFTTRANKLMLYLFNFTPLLIFGNEGATTSKEEDNPEVEGTSCEYLGKDDDCMDKCLKNEFKKPKPRYRLLLFNCQSWAKSTYNKCESKCNKNFEVHKSWIPYKVPKLPEILNEGKYKY